MSWCACATGCLNVGREGGKKNCDSGIGPLRGISNFWGTSFLEALFASLPWAGLLVLTASQTFAERIASRMAPFGRSNDGGGSDNGGRGVVKGETKEGV